MPVLSRFIAGLGRVALILLVAGLAGFPSVIAEGRISAAADEPAGDGAGEEAPGTLIPLILAPEEVQTYVPPPAALGRPGAQAATFNVTYSGFSPEAREAFQRAVAIWETQLTSSVTIRVIASWQPLPTGVLGSAGPIAMRRDFGGAPRAGTWYPSALANKLAHADLDTTRADINANFSSAFTNWFFGTGPTPPGRVNFTSVVLHELGHGLGFLGSASLAGGNGSWGFTGYPTAYDRGVVNGSGQSLLNTTLFPNPSGALAAQLTGNNLYFDGVQVRAQNGGAPARLHAPPTWVQGSSQSHLAESAYPPGDPNALMTPSIASGETIYDPGPIARGLMADLGWTVNSAASPIPSPPPADFSLALTHSTGGTVGATPTLITYPPGTPVTLVPVADPGFVFFGWTVDGEFRGWANPLTLTMNGNHSVAATFSAGVPFTDVPAGQPYTQPIAELAARGHIRGYGNGTYGPADTTLRAQMAALIARALGYSDSAPNPFADRCDPTNPANCVDDELWNRVAELASRSIARGYTDPATCAPSAPPCYAPRDDVLHAQVLSFITRAMIIEGYWTPQTVNGLLYGGVLNGTGHEEDVTTYVFYTQGFGGVPDYPAGGTFGTWNLPSTRAWFARALWTALNSYWGVDVQGAGGYVP